MVQFGNQSAAFPKCVFQHLNTYQKKIGGDTTKVYINIDPFIMSNNFDSPFLFEKGEFSELRCELVELHDIPEIVEHYFPRKDTLVCNAVVSALMDDSLFVQRSVYDFILRFFPLDGLILSDSEKIRIVSSAVDSIMGKNESVVRRMHAYLFDIFKSSVADYMTKQSALSLVIEGIKMKMNSINFENEIIKKEETILSPILIILKILEDEPTASSALFEKLALAIVQYAERAASALKRVAELGLRRQLLEQTAKVLLGSEERSFLLFDAFSKTLENKSNSSGIILQSTIKSLKFVIDNIRNETHPVIGAHLELVILKLLNIVGFAVDPTEILNLLLRLWDYHQPEAGPGVAESALVFAKQYNNILNDDVRISVANLRNYTFLAIRCFSLTEWPYDLTELILTAIFRERKIPEFATIYLEALFSCPALLQNIPEESKLELITIFWDLLHKTSVSKKIVELSFANEKVWGKAYSEFVIQQFKKEKNEENAISRFSKLWRSAETYCPGRTPLSEDPRCLFGMLNFLIHENPIVRHASVTWLRALPSLEAVLNPLCEELLTATDEESFIQGDSTDMLYSVKYDTQQILFILKLLRSLILSHKDKFIRYIMQFDISASCLEKLNSQKAIKLFNTVKTKKNYLNLLLFLLLKYTLSSVLSSESEDTMINLSASELLQILLESLPSPEAGAEAASLLVHPLIAGLHKACLLYTSPSPRDLSTSRMPSSA
eukprot:TRINITY_DN9915_c0_g1_i2.p1 TRINITY_DN9915_c0_g1~~TRINITY_DN9915_c0_g1_i2.p1  ORF type:complete len:722 (-),score=90.30 TRINITY_DN9915_c0_g1_i2:143-2308(-)